MNLLVSFCCNNEHGEPTGTVSSIDCYATGDVCFELEALEPVWFGWEKDGHGLPIGCFWLDGRRYRTGAVTHWVGNMFWDTAPMCVAEMAGLLNRLRKDPNWTLDAANMRLWNAWDKGEDVTDAQLASWCREHTA